MSINISWKTVLAVVVIGSVFLFPSTASAKRGYCGNCRSTHACSYCLDHYGVCHPNKEACEKARFSKRRGRRLLWKPWTGYNFNAK